MLMHIICIVYTILHVSCAYPKDHYLPKQKHCPSSNIFIMYGMDVSGPDFCFEQTFSFELGFIVKNIVYERILKLHKTKNNEISIVTIENKAIC